MRLLQLVAADRLSDDVRETASIDASDEQRSKSEDRERHRQPERRRRGALEAT